MKTREFYVLAVIGSCMAVSFSQSSPRDLDRDKTLYVVGYSHLDTQWRWNYETTIDQFIKNTLDDNFKLLEKYPNYVFNFTGAARYAMTKEYYPEKYDRLKKYIAEKRWFVSGSSVDECDVLIPSPESVLRQILYGNQYFRKEFDVESVDFMLPDCFGFPAYLPTLWSHAGLLGFSTQKLTWESVVGIPFNVGVWEGPDGNSVIAALNPGGYVHDISERLDISDKWLERINENGQRSGVYADYHYYGVGDQGGAPEEKSVQMAVASLGNKDSKINVVLGSSDQLYKDITPEQKARLPKYRDELMLTEHSSGSVSSQAYMKRWNRKNEQLADAAERSAVMSNWLGATDYPTEQINRSWWRVLASQMHDILPGTAEPKAYEYAWNDEIIASNGFAAVLTNSIGGISMALDTRVKGQAIVVYNPLSIQREDVVTAKISFPDGNPDAVRVYDYHGKEVPSQILEKGPGGLKIIFLADMPSVGVGVYDVRPSSKACVISSGLRVDNLSLENKYYRVLLNKDGDIAGVYDKQAGRELLSRPARLEFHRGTPSQYPAWNMDWKDRAFPAVGYVDGPAEINVVEKGAVRVTVEVKRTANNSIFTQRICLAAGDCGKRVEIYNTIDWQSSACVLKASFPLTVSNQVATYTQGLGTIQRKNNNPRQYEMLSHEWFDLTDSNGEYGVSILEDCKFGSDKPADDVIRLTLLYTPGAKHRNYLDQLTQDWGQHEFTYALYGHEGSWQKADSEFQGRRLNQPMEAFQVNSHPGVMGLCFSLLQLNTQQVDVRAMKKAEEGDFVVIRMQELLGKKADGVVLNIGQGIASGYEVDGQERKIGQANIVNGKLHLDMSKNAIRSFALKLAESPCRIDKPVSKKIALAYNVSAFSTDGGANDGAFGKEKRSMPAEMIPASLWNDSIKFTLGEMGAGQKNAMACQGQTINLPEGDYNRVYILASADEDTQAEIQIGKDTRVFSVQAWTGYVGQYDNRIWDKKSEESNPDATDWLTGIQKGYIKRDVIAWFSTHRHDTAGKNEAYHFSYIFKYGFDLPAGTSAITLPDNSAIKVFAVSVAKDMVLARPACDLYDNFDGREEIVLRRKNGDSASIAQPLQKNNFEKWGRETLETIERDHKIDGASGYYEDQKKEAVAFTWGNSMLLLAYAKAAEFDKTYEEPLDRLMQHINRYWIVDKGIGGYDHLPHPKPAVERYYDDNAWIAMGQIDAYHATGKEAYLLQAAKTLDFCLSGIDREAGGVWWRDYWESESQKTKNTCSVAPIAFSCLRYYEVTNQKSYLETAKELMIWLDSHLKDTDSLYFDHLKMSGKIGRTKWSYNSAMPLRCYVMLYKLTGQKEYLEKAVQIAKAAENQWYDAASGAIKCNAMFAFTLVEGWVELSAITNDMHWRNLAESSLSYVHENVRDVNGRYSNRWDGKNAAPISRWLLLYPAATARAYWVLAK
jgi:alpha-mannosidase